MDEDIEYKSALLLGADKTAKLKNSCVAVVGLGGVGGFACEALVRSCVGALILIDGDRVEASNLNRQIIALSDNIGLGKAQLAARRAAAIEPRCRCTVHAEFVNAGNTDAMGLETADYIIDAIDDIDGKIALIKYAQAKGVPLISAMGTGNRTDITRLKTADIYATSGCPFAKAVRRRCREEGIASLRVVYSDEIPAVRPQQPASMIFVPAAAGLLLAREVVMNIAEKQVVVL